MFKLCIFLILNFAQNTNCGHSLEPPLRVLRVHTVSIFRQKREKRKIQVSEVTLVNPIVYIKCKSYIGVFA